MGFEFEWQMDMWIGGMLVVLIIIGGLDIVCGIYFFLGKWFDVSKGLVCFCGGVLFDFDINIQVMMIINGIIVVLNVMGMGQWLQIVFILMLVLLQDEVLSWLLFGSSFENLLVIEVI